MRDTAKRRNGVRQHCPHVCGTQDAHNRIIFRLWRAWSAPRTRVSAWMLLVATVVSVVPLHAGQPQTSMPDAGGDRHARPPARADRSQQTDDGAGILERMQRAFEVIVERVGPAVVTIQAARRPADLAGGIAPSSPDFLNTGSGVIIREDGMVLTSQHVIDGAAAIHVTLYDGRRCRAALVAADPRSDLAVLHIDALGLQPAELGDVRHVRRGHIVLALGNPLGLSADGQAAVSQGVVSAIGRPLPQSLGLDEDRYYGDMIQTSARVGPGSSGGPLVDVHGRVIGVITALGMPAANVEGIGFAVPIGPDTKAIIEMLLEGRHIDYGYLGVQVAAPSEAQARAAGLTDRRGALLDGVLAGGPAARAGLRAGDIITAVGETAVQSADHFIRLVGAAGPGQKIEISFIRGTERTGVTVGLGRRAAPVEQPMPARTATFRGATLGEVGPEMRDWVNLPGPALLVTLVVEGTPADRAGLTPGDIIVRIEGRPLAPGTVSRLADMSGDVLLGLASGGSVLVKE